MILSTLAIPVMWWLARRKAEVADQLASRALHTDAIESTACGYLSGVLIVGLVTQLIMPGWWCVDSIASLAIVILLVKEEHEPCGRGTNNGSRLCPDRR